MAVVELGPDEDEVPDSPDDLVAADDPLMIQATGDRCLQDGQGPPVVLLV